MNPNELAQQVANLQKQVTKLTSDLGQLQGSFFKNNFGSTQTFNKAAIFSDRLRVPVFDAAPTVAEIGDIFALTDGELYICTTASTGGSGAVFSLVGTQS